jgi:hypothetical protein
VAPGSIAATKSVRTGNGWYSISIKRAASAAISSVSAATPATISPSNRTVSFANRYRSRTKPP